MATVADAGVKMDPPADSPTSVLEEEEKPDILNDNMLLEAKNGDSTLISSVMTAEEEKLMEARVKEEEPDVEKPPEDVTHLNETQYTKLDELLTQTQMYSEFLLEKMDDIILNGVEEQVANGKKGKKRGRGSKKPAAQYDNKKAKRAVAAMLTINQEGRENDSCKRVRECSWSDLFCIR